MKKYTRKNGTVNTAQELSNYLLDQLGSNLKQAVKSCVEVCVRAEMETIRSNASEELVFNGSYNRNLVSTHGKTKIALPRFRSGNKEHEIKSLDVFQEQKEFFEDLVGHMHLAGISQRKVDKLSKAIFNKAVPPQTTRRIFSELMEQEAFQINKRSLAGKTYEYLFADGIWISTMGSLSKKKKDRVVLAVYGYSKEVAEGEFLGFQMTTSESGEEWKKLFDTLKSRGLDIEKSHCLSADDGAGLLSVIEDIAPKLHVQVCIAHRYRNVICHASRKNKKAIAEDLKKLTACITKEDAKKHIKEMEKKWILTEERAMKSLVWNVDLSLTYFDFPEEDWKLMRTTNKLERSFREVRRRTVVSDHHFQSDESAMRYINGALGMRVL